MKGACSEDPHIVHQYALTVLNGTAANPSTRARTRMHGVDPTATQANVNATTTGGAVLGWPARAVARFGDIVDDSCLNGWSCGNIAATAEDITQWWWDIFHFKLVNETTLAEMLNEVPLTKGWNPGLPYGLGLMHFTLPKDMDGQLTNNDNTAQFRGFTLARTIAVWDVFGIPYKTRLESRINRIVSACHLSLGFQPRT